MRKFENVEKVRLNKKGRKAVAEHYEKYEIPKGVGRIVTYDEHYAPEVGVEWEGIFLYVPEDLLDAADEDADKVAPEPEPARLNTGDVVRLSKSGVKYVKETWAEEFEEDPEDFPFDGELGVITNVFGDDEPHTPGMVYVEWRNYADYLKPEHLLLGTEREFPAKVPAYEVRIGDVVKDEDGEEFTVRMIEEETEDGELYFWGLDSDGYGATRHVGPTKKVKVFKREYK